MDYRIFTNLARKNRTGGFFMKRKHVFMAGVAALMLSFGLVLAGCDNGTTEDEKSKPKTLIIQGLPANVYAYGQSGGRIGIFPAGTTSQQALSQTGIVAGADLSNGDIIFSASAPYTLTIPLYNINNGNRWTGSGTFAVYVILNGGNGHYYKADSVSITSGTTTVPFSSATEVFQQ
jgi:hypothetical protein